MITNERQYKITKSQAEKFENSLSSFDKNNPKYKGLHPKIIEAQYYAIKAQLDDLLEQINEYEEIKSGKFSYTSVDTLEDLPLLLIKARIAKGLTQADLANTLGMKEQQIQRYESQKYGTANLDKLKSIANALSIQINSNSLLTSPESIIHNYPVKTMYSRGWFDGFTGSAKQANDNAEELLQNFFTQAELDLTSPIAAMHKQNIRTGGKFNNFALHAWHARILIKAKQLDNEVGAYKKKNLTAEWIQGLVGLSTEVDGVVKAKKYLLDSGIRFVVEPHLPETHLDGACLLLDKKYPVVAMTLRHDRLDNFWFVLLHELAHLILHVNEDASLEFFDDLDCDENGVEQEADNYALNALIDDGSWSRSISRFICTRDAILKEAASWGVSPAIVAGRIRRETGKYVLFSDLVGQGDVRKHFNEDIYE